MSPTTLDRRAFLGSGLTIAGATLLGAPLVGCNDDRIVAPPRPAAPRLAAVAGDDLADPRTILSAAGVLSTSLAIGTAPIVVGGRQTVRACTYEGSFPGPTLWARPGDLVDILLTNRIGYAEDSPMGYGRPPRHVRATNLHFHGLHVPFTGTADNMLALVEASDSFRYGFRIPPDHPAGLFWYHAHVHGTVTSQVGRGAAGMLYVANAYTDYVASLGIRRRLLALQQAYYEEDLKTIVSDDGDRDDPELALSLINGQRMPKLRMRPGEPQVWCLLNASTSAFYRLRLEGHTFDVIADDGVPLPMPRAGLETVVLPSGKRLEVVVKATKRVGSYALSYDAYDQGVDTWPAKSIGTVVVDGALWRGPGHPGVDTTVPADDLSKVGVAARRRITLGTNTKVAEGEFGRFTIDGHAWDPAIGEWTSTVGTVEEWDIVNETEQEHPFHVHVNPFQITQVNGKGVPFDGYQDTAIVPRYGSLRVRTRLADFTGPVVLMHCHILDHEDMGMMTRFEIAAR